MKENKKDLYPNLGLADIIKILYEKDLECLALEDFSSWGVKTRCDFSYKNDRNLYHDFDIYYGNSSHEDLHTIIIVHGGGLVYGAKELDKNMGIYFAQNGFNVANINYRLLPDVTFTKQIQDLADAFAYIYQNSSKLKLNRDKIFILSDSAGSFLSLGAFALMKDTNIRQIFGINALNFDISALGFISPMTGLVKAGSLSLINKHARRNLSKEKVSFTVNILKTLENTTLPTSIMITSE
ncbi:alpha/beta hydrolase [uncultured Anaerococcus sp.]|uniref:alpha/beta hydrolase n=1 Tax=uncultured Anaerococcus sp. TaxID=293428 RepID=UPI0025E8AB17|nr:alpha/beta hydrolase [uncultured Anaerococcus sp.]